ncbi:hypothetical protein ACWEN6_13555 [Sphaerisporangium sp. NPDC004334]
MGLAYATSADYVNYTGQTPPADIARRLERASERVDEMLLSAVYATNNAGLPTDPDEADALKRATCAQAAWLIEHGDEYGVAAAFSEVEIASVRIKRAGGDTGSPARHSPDAAAILHTAGLLPGYIIDGPPW